MMLKLKPGVYRTNKTMQIGSMQLVGARNLAVFSALSALYRDVHNLFVRNGLKKDLAAARTEIIDISASFENRPNE
jgi:hypothetical protein